jgi:thiol-disulfide isomerase/thioredoxin
MPGRSSLKHAVVILLALLHVACSGGRMGGANGGGGDDHPMVGVQAPPFDLPPRNGSARASLADASGKVAIVDFWATWCKPCKESFPFYQRLADEHAGQVVVIAISTDDEPDGIAAFASETGAKFPIGWDEGGGLAQQYSPPTMPTSYIVDKNGIVRYVHAGYRAGSSEEIESMVSSLLK